MSNRSQVLVIGIGSPFGADRLAWEIIEGLRQQASLLDNKQVVLQTCDRPGTLLLEYLKGADDAVLIDAIEGGIAGNVRIIDKSQLLQSKQLQSSHDLGVAETIALGEELRLLPGNLLILGVETGNAPADYRLSDETTTTIIKLVNEYTPESAMQ